MPDYDYDVLVIGAGPGGYVAAIRAAQLGLKTACAEERETLGGTCLNVGCIPSKALLHASELYEEAHSGALEKFGIRTQGVSLDIGLMQAEKSKAVEELISGIEGLFRKNKVSWLKGRAAFTGSDRVTVNGKTIRAKNIVIATGSSVTALPCIAIDNERILDSTGALALLKIPGHLAVIGGGAIGLELGSLWRRLGAKVTVVEYLDQILPGMDEEIRKSAADILTKQGLTIQTSTKLSKVSRTTDGVTLALEPSGGGANTTIEADAVLIATGRRPNTDGLALDKAGLTLNDRGQLMVDHEFHTGVAGIYAIGDVTPGPMLAHRAEDEGIAVAELIAGHPGMVNHDVIPSIVYTNPEIASVGLTEAQARARGPIRIGRFPFLGNSRAKANRDTTGFVKIIADEATDRVLGVHIISPLAGALIAQAAQAMELGAASEDIAYTCHAHPTHAEALKEAAMAVRGKPIHI